MTAIAINDLPDDIFQGIVTLGYFPVPLDSKPEQAAQIAGLRSVVDSGCVEQLPEALREISRAFTKNIDGRNIPISRNWVKRTASHLANSIEDLLTSGVRTGPGTHCGVLLSWS